MTLLEIETFLSIVKHGSLSAASKNLFISQPALTRRIQLMEQELGYPLIKRQKGHRTVQLTDQGLEFYHIAWKWQQLLEETNSISAITAKESLSVASVNSVSQYLLTHILPDFLKLDFRLRLYNAYSEDSYQYMAQGLYDLAFIEQQDFTTRIPSSVHTNPAFSESFVVATYGKLPDTDHYIDINCLMPEKEIYVPWNNEFKAWHADHFNEKRPPLVFLEDVSMLNCFFIDENWVIVPYTTGMGLREIGANIYLISDGPPRRIIYYLTRGTTKKKPIKALLTLLDSLLQTMPTNEIESFLRSI